MLHLLSALAPHPVQVQMSSIAERERSPSPRLMLDSLKHLIARQAEDRIRACMATIASWQSALPVALPEELAAEILQASASFESTASEGLDAAARGDAAAAIPAAVRCETLTEALSTLLRCASSPEGVAGWIAERERERAERERRAREEEERRREEERREREEQERLRILEEERAKIVDFFRARPGLNATELPDDEQADVIRHKHGHLLVTARAGAGKTRALTYRAVYLTEAEGVAASRVLLLAFNRKAAGEIERRLEAMGGPVPPVMTFHALARSLVNVPGDILTDDEDDQGFSRLRDHLSGLIVELERTEPMFEPQLRQLMLALATEVVEVPEGSVQTIDGHWVESFERKLLWDFLFERGFQPEKVWAKTGREGSDEPFLSVQVGGVGIAFSLGDSDSSNLSVAASREGGRIRLKRGFPWEGKDAVQARWTAFLHACGLAMTRLSEEQLWRRVEGALRREFIGAATTYVMRMRNQGLDPDERRRLVADHAPVHWCERSFLALAEKVHERYEALIASDQVMDFQEVILRAARRIEEGHTSWSRKEQSGDVRLLQHLMIDEFQDVSPLFMRLVAAIRSASPQVSVMGVGDDWQAINGFAGATTAYFREFGKHFDGATNLELRTNYRSGKWIVAVGNAVMAGKGRPALAARSDRGIVQVADVSEFLPVESEPQGGSWRMTALRRLGQHFLNAGKTVALLSRTRRPADFGKKWLDDFRRDLHPMAQELVSGSTVHQFKGKQAQVVIVVDASERAFPVIGRNWIFFRVFGDTMESLVEDERRLFYVAVTRAADELILVTDGSLKRGGLTPLCGTSSAEVASLQWDRYPPIGDAEVEVCRVEVSNMSAGWQDAGGTVPIKQLLKAHGYLYLAEPSPRWVRAVVIPKSSSTRELCEAVLKEGWVEEADRVLVTFVVGGREAAVAVIASGHSTMVKPPDSGVAVRESNFGAKAEKPRHGAPRHVPAAVETELSGRPIETHVAGVQYLNADGSSRYRIIADECHVGMLVDLRRDLFNAHDENAIEVIVGDSQIGFVPKPVAAQLARLMDAGAACLARVTSVHREGGNYLGVHLRIDIVSRPDAQS